MMNSLEADNNLTQDASVTVDDPTDITPPPGWGRIVRSDLKHGDPSSSHILTDANVSVGRKSSNTIQIKHAAVSGHHCSLHWDASLSIAFCEDHSTNGTFVNGERIGKDQRVIVSHGSEIALLRSPDKIAFHIYYNKLPPQTSSDNEPGGPFDIYERGQTLGSGAFATVCSCIHRRTGEVRALKIISKKKFQTLNGSARENTLMDEVKILNRLKHPNIVQVYEIFETEQNVYLVMELLSGGDLFDKIISLNGRGFDETSARYIFKQLIDATDYLHQNNIVHRDLKPENVLLISKTSLDLKLTDFGLSRVIAEGSMMKTLCGTPQYLAPEVLSAGHKGGYKMEVDLWSLGVILYILLSGTAPFSDNDHLAEQIKQGKYAFPVQHWRNVSVDARELISGLLCVDPRRRLTIVQVKAHRWMNVTPSTTHLHPPTTSTPLNGTPTSKGKKRKEMTSRDEPSSRKKPPFPPLTASPKVNPLNLYNMSTTSPICPQTNNDGQNGRVNGHHFDEPTDMSLSTDSLNPAI